MPKLLFTLTSGGDTFPAVLNGLDTWLIRASSHKGAEPTQAPQYFLLHIAVADVLNVLVVLELLAANIVRTTGWVLFVIVLNDRDKVETASVATVAYI